MIYKAFSDRLLITVLIMLVAAATLPKTVFAETKTAPESQAPVVKEQAPLITPWEVKSRLDRFVPIIIVDVRSLEEYRAMHITGSMSVPLDKIETIANAFPKDMTIVFY